MISEQDTRSANFTHHVVLQSSSIQQRRAPTDASQKRLELLYVSVYVDGFWWCRTRGGRRTLIRARRLGLKDIADFGNKFSEVYHKMRY